MKKAKIMLASLSIFAIVGGVLAFKAAYNADYCTAPTQPGKTCAEVFCENLTIRSTTTTIGEFICITNPVNGECPHNLPCFGSTKLTKDF